MNGLAENKPSISVIIPVYGVEKYLQDCIDSLINQTFQDCEFIFVNDASPDRCIDILKKNQEKYPGKIRVLDSEENLGIGGARNLGISVAKGKYIGFVDSDDFAAPMMFELLFNRAEQLSADATFIQYTSIEESLTYSSVFCKSDNTAIPEKRREWEPLINWDQKLLRMQGKELSDQDIQNLIALPIGGVYCGLYKREVLLESGILFPEHIRYEDNYWGCLVKPSFRRVAFVEEVGVFYRQRADSTVHMRNQNFQIEDRIRIEHMIIADAEKKGFLERFYPAYEWGYTFRYAHNTFFLVFYTHDHPDPKRICEIEADLRKRFPKWYNNSYFRQYTGWKEKLKYAMVIYLPKETLFLKEIKNRIAGCLKKRSQAV